MNNHTNSNMRIPSNTKYTWSGVWIIALIAAIGGLSVFLYFINAPEPVNAEIINDRKAKLADVHSKQNELINNYAWVDQTKGVVRIPIERAMQLTVEELRNSKPLNSSNNSQNNNKENKLES